MKTIISPFEVATTVILRRDEPEVVREGLAILRLCAENRELVNRAINGGTAIEDLAMDISGIQTEDTKKKQKNGLTKPEKKFGPLIADFIQAVENGQNPEGLIKQFPNWSISFHGVHVSKAFMEREKAKSAEKLEAKSVANALLGTMAGQVMIIDTLFEAGSEAVKRMNLNLDQEKVRKLRKLSTDARVDDEIRARIGNFLRALYNFSGTFRGIIENHQRSLEGLDSEAVERLRKRQWRQMQLLMDIARASAAELPE